MDYGQLGGVGQIAPPELTMFPSAGNKYFT